MKTNYSNRSIGKYEQRGNNVYSVQILNENGQEHDNQLVNLKDGEKPEQGIEEVLGLKMAKPEKAKDKK